MKQRRYRWGAICSRKSPATSISGPEPAAGILAHLDRVDLIEVIADDYFEASRRDLRALRTLAAQVSMVLHGVSQLDDARAALAAGRKVGP